MVRIRFLGGIFVFFLLMLIPLSVFARDDMYYVSPNPRATIKPTPAPEASPYRIYIEKGAYTLQVYGMDESGEYTVPLHAFLTAVGTGSKTPSGTFKILGKERWHAFNSSSETRDYTYVQYATRFTGGLYIHSPLYTGKSENTMIDTTYREIGTKATSGCLRMSAGAAYWIYENCPVGTEIVVVSDAPLGLSSAKLPPISARGKDPTDPKYAPPPDEISDDMPQQFTLSLDKLNATLKVGAALRLNASLSPLDDADAVILDWATSDTSVIRVNADGRVTALKRGKATVSAISTLYNLSAECVVTVL